MLGNALDRIMNGARTPEGKVIIVLLAICLSLMSWNVAAISYAVGTDSAAVEKAAETASESKAAEEPAPAAEEPAAEEPAAEEPAPAAEEPAPAAEEPAAEQTTNEGAESTETPNAPESTDATDAAAAATAATAADATASSEAAAKSDAAASASSEAAAKSDESADKDKDKEVTYPAASFEGNAGGVYVTASSPEGAFPEGTTMKVSYIAPAEIMDAVEGVVDGDVTQVKAVDITFHDKDGKEIEPKSQISVSLRSSVISEAQADEAKDVAVVHIDDSSNADTVSLNALSGSEAAFTATEFSIYAIVETVPPESTENSRLTVRFVANGAEVASIQVKQADITDTAEQTFDQVVYDPGAGELAEGVHFYGWTTKQKYTAADKNDALTIEGVREAVKTQLNSGITDGTTVTYYAMLFKSHTVTYLGDQDIALGTDEILYNVSDEEGTYYPYTVNMAYTADTGHNFEGWYVDTAKGDGSAIKDWTVDSVYANETEIEINGSVVFSVNAPEGNWLVFDENGKGATYSAPQFIRSGEVTKQPRPDSEMTRLGYTFGGWYDSKENADAHAANPRTTTGAFAFGGTIDDYTTVYASWVSAQTANYTVIVWKESMSDTYAENVSADGGARTYDFWKSYTLTGNVGDTISAVSQVSSSVADADGTYKNLRVRGTYAEGGSANETLSLTGYHAGGYDTDVTITTEGNAIVNVYYDRNAVTYTFYTKGSTSRWYLADASGNEQTIVYTENNGSYDKFSGTPTHGDGVQYYYKTYEEQWTWWGRTWVEVYKPLTWKEDFNNSGNTWSEYQVSKGLYGEKLNWPENNSIWWYESKSGGTRMTYKSDFLPLTTDMTVEYYGQSVPSSATATINFYIQNATLDGYDLGYSVISSGGNFSINDKFTGYTAHHYTVDNSAEKAVGAKNESTGIYGSAISYKNSLNIYFNRSASVVTYFDGAYFDGNGNNLNETARADEFKQSEAIPFGTNLSSYNKGGENYYTLEESDAYHDGYVFAGWYSDKECTSEYTFTEMSDGGITVYAKWVQKQYRVFLHPNVPTDDTSLYWGAEGQSMSFRVNYGAKVSAPTGTRNGYEFVGWFRDAGLTQLFNADAYVLNDTTVTEAYDQTENTELDAYGNATESGNKDAANNRFWVKGKLNLYAKWRATLEGAAGIGVVYDLNGGTGTGIVDRSFYADKAEAVAQAAPTAPEGKRFVAWVVQAWNDEANAYEDTNATVSPGATFTVLKDNAKTTIISQDGDKIIEATYTVQLRAEYVDTDKQSDTHITWFNNYDGGSYTTNANLKINQSVPVYGTGAEGVPTREGYVFKGWILDTENADGMASADGVLYINYNGEGFSVGSTPITQVAADEKQPYQAMYAAWEPAVSVRVTGGSQTVTYNGKTQTYDAAAEGAYTVEYKVGDGGWTTAKPEGVNLTVISTLVSSGVDAGTYAEGTIAVAISAEQGSGVSIDAANASATAATTLVIEPAPATVTTGSANKPYDGTALVAGGSIAGLVNGETATVTATGSQTEVGSSTNTYSIEWGTAKVDNYTITEELGTLTIVGNPTEVTLTAVSDSKTYDGAELANGEVTAAGLPDGFTVEATAAGSQTDAGASANVVNDGYVIKDAAGADKTASFTNVKKVDGTLTVNPAPLTVTTGSASKAYDGTALVKDEATITGLVNGETATATATGTVTEVGSADNTYSIEWGTAKEANYTIAPVLGKLTIVASDADVVLTAPSASKTYDGTPIGMVDGAAHMPEGAAAEVVASGLPEGFTIEASWSGQRTDAGEAATTVDAGYVIKNAAGEDRTDSFNNIQKVNGKLTVTKAAVTITTGSDNKAYDGVALVKGDATITGLVNDEAATVTATGSQTEVGSSTNTYSIDWGTTNKDNYTITENLGTLEVTPNTAEVTLIAASDSKTYDGTALTNAAVTATGLPKGFSIVASATGSQTNAGTSANVVNDGYAIVDAAGVDKTANFANVITADGTLTVNPAPIAIATGSASKAYDGVAATSGEASITGLVNGETATVTATGSQTEVGSSANTYSIEWGDVNSGNYAITENLGTLEVTPNAAKVILTAASAERDYTGEALADATVTATGLPEGLTVTATAAGSQTDAGKSANVVNDGYAIFNGDTDVTSFFTNIQKVNGTLKVNPISVTITTGSASKQYDGTALSDSTATIDGLLDGESVTLAAIGTITEIGSVPNTYSITWDSAKAANYVVAESLGTLTVTANDAEVKLTAASDDKVYDGAPLVNHTVTATGLPNGFTVEAIATGSATDVARDAAGEVAGVANPVADGYVILNSAGEDKTANFTNVVKVAGTLTVTPAALTVTTPTTTKVYDGTPLTAAGTITGLVNGETASFATTGTQTAVGSSENTYSLTWDGTAKQGNYTVNEELGTLSVTQSTDEIVVTTTGGTFTYDGQMHGATVSVSELPAGYTVDTATSSATATDVTAEPVAATADTLIIVNAAGEDVTSQLNVTYVDSTITVNPATLTVTTPTAVKQYDGTALEAAGTITGFVNGETASFATTGTQTAVGSSDNTYSLTWDGTAKESNYTVAESIGTLTVSEFAGEVVVTTTGGESTYDGQAHGATVSVSGLPAGYTLQTATSNATATDVTTADVVATADTLVIVNAVGEDVTSLLNVRRVDGTIKINPAPLTVTTGSASKQYDGTALTEGTATVTGLVNGETANVTATGTITEVGSTSNTYSIAWDGASESNYTISENLGTLVVATNGDEVTLTAASGEKVYDGAALEASAVTASGLPEGFTAEASATGSQTDAGQSANVVNDGYVIRNTAGEDKTANFTNVVKVPGVLTVTPAALTIITPSAGKVYDGTALTAEGTIEGLVNGETATFTTTGTQTAVGTSPNTYSLVWDGTAKQGNYTISESVGTLSVTQSEAEIVVTTTGGTSTYDGQAHGATVSVSGLPAGYTLQAAASDATATDVTTTPVAATADTLVIVNAAGEDVTSQLNVTYVDSTITVNPATLTVTTPTANKQYDGAALEAAGTITGFVNGETASFATTGTQTAVGSSQNTYTLAFAGEGDAGADATAKRSNYVISESVGTLTVSEFAGEVVVTTTGGTSTYDGQAHGATVNVSALPTGYTVQTAASSATATDVTTADVVATADTLVIVNAAGIDVTANLRITRVDGTIKVNPAPLSVTTGSASKQYDGTALIGSGATIDGLVNGETANVTATGTITEIGEASNTYSIMWGSAKKSNYAVTENLGTLTITANSGEVTLTAASGEKVYDGSALEASAVTASGLPAGFAAEATAAGSQTDAGESANVVNDGYLIRNTAGEDKTANFTNVAKVAGALVVSPAKLTVTTPSADKVYDGTALEAAGTVTGFVNGETATFTTTGTQTDVGSSSNSYTLAFAGEEGAGADATAKRSNYTISESVGTLSVTQSEDEIVVTTTGGEFTYDGQAHGATVTVSTLPTGYTLQTAASSATATDVTTADVVATADTLVIVNAAGEDVTSQLNITRVDGTIKVNPATLTVTTPDAQKQYDGAALEAVGTVTGFVNGETATFATTGTQTAVGSSENTYSLTWDGTAKESNYAISENVGTLTVNASEAEVTLTAASAERAYTGAALTNATVTASGLPAGHTATATAAGSQTDAGESANVVNDGYVIANAAGDDVTAYFANVKKADGTLKVNPVSVTITTGSASKQYDGTELTNSNTTITGLVNGESVTLAATGTITEIGEASNTYSIEWDGASESNYTVTESLGTLAITANSAQVTLTAASDSKTYDGTALEAPAVTASGLPTGFTVDASAAGSQTNAGESANVVNGGYIIRNTAGEDKTANFTNVVKVAGTLTVGKRPVKLASASLGKTYDGTALVNGDNALATETGWAAGEGATYLFSGSQTNAGQSANAFTYKLNEGTLADNYTITKTEGTLTITPVVDQVTVTITEHSGGDKYSGAVQTVSGYDVATSNPLYTSASFTFNGDATVSGTNAGEYPMQLASGDFANASINFSNVQFVIVDGALTITPREITLASATDSKVYNGTALTNGNVTVGGDGFVAGEGATYTVTGSQLTPGASENTFTYELNEGTLADNYSITLRLGTLTVTNRGSDSDELYEITVVANSSTDNVYDGTAKSATGFETLTFEVENNEGVTNTYTVSGLVTEDPTQVNAGTYTNNITGTPVVSDAAGNDVTNQFSVNTQNGSLVIGKAAVTLVSADLSKVYDGTALVNGDTALATEDGWAAGEGATYSFGGSQTNVGQSANAFTYTLNEGTLAGNYDISQTAGTLSVTPIADAVTVTIAEHSGTAKYNGQEQVVSGYDVVSISNPLYQAGYFTFGGDANVSGVNAGEYPMQLAAGDFANASDNFSNVEFVIVDGALTITPREVTLESATDSKVYSGTPLINGNVTVGGDGFVAGEGANYDVTGGQTLVGSSANAFAYELFANTLADNYVITPTEGTLTVTAPATNPDGPGKFATKTHNGTAYKRGEDITWDISVTNIFAEAQNITLEERDGFALGQASFENVAPGATVSTTATHTVTEADILAGEVNNSIGVSFGGIAIVEPDPEPVSLEPLDTSLVVYKTISNKPANNEAFVVGEAIEYEITVTNEGNVAYSNVTVVDADTGLYEVIESLAVGETVTFTTRHVVTEADVVAGSYTNTVTAQAEPIVDPATGDEKTPLDSDSITTGDASDPNSPIPPIAPKNGHITLTKDVTSRSTDENGYVQGETIRYSITARNDGNVALSGVVVTDELTNGEWEVGVLAPGASREFTTEYVVTAADERAGSVLNVVTATGADPSGDAPVVDPGQAESRTTASYELRVDYVYDNGNTAAESYVARLAEGEAYDATSPTIDGYTPDFGRVVGSMPAQNVTVTITYSAPAEAPAAAPAAVAPVGTITISDDGTPLIESIDDVDNALAGGKGQGQGGWSLFNVLCTILTVILAIVMLIGLFGRKRKEGEEEEAENVERAEQAEDDEAESEPDQVTKRRRAIKLLSIVPAVVAVVVLFLTQDFSQPMVIFDAWSILFAIIAIINIVLRIVSIRRKSDDDDGTDEEQQSGYAPATA